MGFPIQTRPSSESPYLAVGFVHTPSAIHCPIAKASWLDASALFLKEISGKVIRIKRKVALPAGWFGVDIGGGDGRC